MLGTFSACISRLLTRHKRSFVFLSSLAEQAWGFSVSCTIRESLFGLDTLFCSGSGKSIMPEQVNRRLRLVLLLLLWGDLVTAFSPKSTSPSYSTRKPVSPSLDEQQTNQRLSRNCQPSASSSSLYQASVIEDTLWDFSADSQDDEHYANPNGEIQITDLSEIVHPNSVPDLSTGHPVVPSQQHPAVNGQHHHKQPHHRRGGGHDNRKNEAMADTSFLRKRTANLLKVTTAAHYQGNENDSTIRALGGSMKIDKKTFHFLLDAWAFSGEPDAVQQATRLVQRMEDLQSWSNGMNMMSPDVRSYTKLINAISRSGEHNAGERAEEILHKMEMLADTGENVAAKPNTFTYTAVIEAHANAGAPGSTERAHELCEIMVDKYAAGDADVTPTARAFQAALVAYAKSQEMGSAEHAENLVYRMEELYESGIEEMKPTAVNLNTLITAWANCGAEGSAQRAEEVLRRMEYLYKAGDEDLKPTTVSFNAVIDAYAKSGEEGSAENAEETLKRMEELYETGKNLDAKPNVRSFNSVINAWAKSRDQNNALRAQEILDFMEKLYEQGDVSLRPDVLSFSTVINAWARSNAHGKADRALNLFREMETLYKAGNNKLRPTVVSFNAVMNACAYTSNSDLHEQNRAIEIAHKMFRKLENSPYGSPDQVTYGTFLKVCANQMSDCSTRQQIVETIFKKCCNDGQVGNLVIQQLRAICDEEQYGRLVGRSVLEDIRMEDLPSDLWCNVVEGRWRRRKNLPPN